MYSLIAVPLSEEKKWDALVSSYESGNFYQSMQWAHFKASQGWTAYRFGIESQDKKELVGGSTVYQYNFSNGSSFLHLPAGPLIDFSKTNQPESMWKLCAHFLQSLVKQQPQRTVSHIRFEPRITQIPAEWKTFFLSQVTSIPRYTQIIDLTQTSQNLLAHMSQKTRYNISLAQKKGVRVTHEKFTREAAIAFAKLYESMAERKEIKTETSEKLFVSLVKTCGDNITVTNAWYKNTLIASALIMHYGKKSTYLYGASNYEDRSLQAPSLVQWESIINAQVRGSRSYDLYGVLPKDYSGEHPWKKISAFKRAFGGEPVTYIGAYDWILDKEAYKTSPANRPSIA